MAELQEPQRCRLVLVASEKLDAAMLQAALSGGDVASVILPRYGLDEARFQEAAAALVPVIQSAGAAAILAGDDLRVAMRLKADGVHVEAGKASLRDILDRNGGRLIVGAGGAQTRDGALVLGELQPDYLFFGRFGHDTRPEPHRKNLALAQWWAQMIEIPCIVLGGSEVASAPLVAATGAEFVALANAIWNHPADPATAVRLVNEVLDAAPSSVAGGDALAR